MSSSLPAPIDRNLTRLIANLPPSVIGRMITTYLAELGRGATEAEIWDELDPAHVVPWDVRRDILGRLIVHRRVEKVEARDCRFHDVWIHTYRLITELEPKQGRLF